MYRTSFASIALALAASATVASAAEVEWVASGGGSWGDNSKWSDTPDWTGTDVLKLNAGTLTADSILTLDGDRVIDTLSVYTEATASGADHTFIIQPGTGGTLRLNKLIVDRNSVNTNYRAYALSLKDVVVKIDNGINAEDAVWEFMPSAVNFATVQMDLGEVHSVAGSTLRIDYKTRSGGSNGNNYAPITFTKSNPNFLGDIAFHSVQANSKNLIVEVGASDALGVGQVSFTRASTGLEVSMGFTATSDTTHVMDIYVDSQFLRLAAKDNTTATIYGNLTGNGSFGVRDNLSGYYTIGTGTVVLAGDNNTLSGDVSIGITNRTGNLRVDGTWTGAGNITLGKGMLSGSGVIGMAQDKTFTTGLSSTQANHPSYIAPGTDGTIGTLTIGTLGNNNTFTFQGASGTQTNLWSLLIDLDGAVSDVLVLNGNVTIGAFTKLVFNELGPLTAPSYTLLTYSGTLSGTFAEVEGLPDGYTLDYSTPGQINLVPEPAALGLLSLGGLALLRRRR